MPPRNDRDYGKDTSTYLDHDVTPFDRKAGYDMLKTLMGGKDVFGKRSPENVQRQIDAQGARSKDISGSVRPDLENDDNSAGDES